MATVSTAKRNIEVTLVRPDVEAQTFTLPEGATLGDLLREAGAIVVGPRILIDGRSIEDATPLKHRMTITLDAEEAPGASKGWWRASAGKFSHPDVLREIIAEGRAIREADREAARQQAGQDDQ